MKKILSLIFTALVGLSLWCCQEEDPHFIYIEQDSIIANPEPYKLTIDVKSNVKWTVSSDADWCSISGENGSYTSSFELVLERNNTINDRTASVTVSGGGVSKIVSVTQTSPGYAFSLPLSKYTADNNAQSISVAYVLSLPGATVEAFSNAKWAKPGIAKDGVLEVEIEENNSGEIRNAEISLVAQGGSGDPITAVVTIQQATFAVAFEFVRPELQLEYIASTASAILLASGDWEIVNLANKPSWISINPASGTDGATFEVKVSTNKYMATRSFAFAFRNTTYGNFASLVVSQEGDPTGIKDLGYLGRGYDASGEYAHDSYVRHNVLDQDSLVLYDHVADIISVNATKEETITGTTLAEFETNYSVSAGVSGTYKGFTASVESNYSQYALESSEHSFGTWRHMTQKKKLTLFQNEGAAELMNALSKDFRRDIGFGGNTASRLTPGQLIQKYGTHIVTGYALGGVLEYSMSADVTESLQTTSWGVAVKGGFESAAYGVSASVAYDQFNSVKNNSASFESKLVCRGGQSQYSSMTSMGSQSMYNEWLSSLADATQWVMVNYESPMIPISEFIDDDSYKAEVETYLETYLAGLSTEQQSTHKPLTLSIESISTNMDDAGSSCEFYMELYVKLDNQQWNYYSKDDWGLSNFEVPEGDVKQRIGKSNTVRTSPLKNHTVKLEFKNIYEDDVTDKDIFNDLTYYLQWDGTRWSNNGTYLNDDGTFKVELVYQKDSKTHIWIFGKLVWGD